MPSLMASTHGSHAPLSDARNKGTHFTGRNASTPMSSSSGGSPVALAISMESPPLVMFGPPDNSTGALASGLLDMTVFERAFSTRGLQLKLVVTVCSRRPVVTSCDACKTFRRTIQTWNFIDTPRTLLHGTHSWPFSYLLPGHFPASIDTNLASISYSLEATLFSAFKDAKPASQITMPLKLSRSILPDLDKTAQRVFPPTDLSATVILPNVFHPGSSHSVDVTFSGMAARSGSFWRLRKLSWRIDETQNVVSEPCQQHLLRLQNIKEGVRTRTGLQFEEVRTVGAGDVKSGWKSDETNGNGRVELELMVSTHFLSGANCDINTSGNNPFQMPITLDVSHALTMEAIVVEEAIRSPGSPPVATGAARILRMSIPIKITERSGLGVSWDEECPPMFEDVGAAPPEYEDVVTAESLAEQGKEVLPLEGVNRPFSQ